MRLGVDVSYSTVTASSANCVVTFRIYSENKYAYNDTQTLTYSGTAGITGTFNFTNNQGAWDGPGGTGPTLRDTKTWTYIYPAGGQGASKTFTATLSGAFNNVTPTVTVTATTPQRGAAPPAVTNLVLERVTDSQGIVTWNNPGGPITTNTVMRQEYGLTGGWVDITPPYTSATPIETLTSNSFRPNMLFRFQVRANNTVGSGPYATSNLIMTTPAAPGNVQAVRRSNGAVAVTWAITHPPTNQGQDSTRYTQRVERSPDGTVWTVVNPQFVPSSSGTQTWTDTSAPHSSVRYRVITSTPSGLESAPGISNVVAAFYTIYQGLQKAVKIYRGYNLATRIYQGTVLVWEDRVPPIAATWDDSFMGGQMLKLFVPMTGLLPSSITCSVPTYTKSILNPSFCLGRSSTTANATVLIGSTSSTATEISDAAYRNITNQQAVDTWGGHTLKFTIYQLKISRVEILE